jgi:hypothetical protein
LAQAAPEPAWGDTTVRFLDLNDEPGVMDPQFSWDPISGAVRYEVEVSPSSDWAVGSRVCCVERVIGTSLSPVRLLPNNSYYWRMRGIDAAGNAGVWNVGAPFEKDFDHVAGQPTIKRLHLRDNLADPAVDLDPGPGAPETEVPIVSWDPVPGASSYEVQVSPYNYGGVFGCNWTAIGNKWDVLTAATSWTALGPSADTPSGVSYPSASREPQHLVDGGTYCVRVAARSDRDQANDEVVSDWTQLNGEGQPAFTWRAPAIDVPAGELSMPAANYRLPQSGALYGRLPLFTWQPVPAAHSYYVVVAKDALFTNVVDVAHTYLPAYAPRKGSKPWTYPDETTTYYWAVYPAQTASGQGVTTSFPQNHPQPFNKLSAPPTPLEPLTGVTGEPSFRWTSTEGARSYRIQADSDPNFGSPITDVVTNSTAYTSLNKYPPNIPLYWRVRANDENLIGLAWSTVATFSALPPETYLDPGPVMNAATASFTFASNLPDATFKCKLNGPGAKLGILAPCRSPASYPSLADGAYTFIVTASDLAGNADPSPATRQFTVDTTAPDTAISARPAAQTPSSTAALSFTATKAGSTFDCKLDGPGNTHAWGPCSSPEQYDGLADGTYTFSVRATDPAGSTDPTPATAGFTVDTLAPDTMISTGPAPTTDATTVTFVSAASQASSSFACRLDRPAGTGDWASCGSSVTYQSLAAGAYTFSVRATDAAGNTDATPATWAFALTAPASSPPPTAFAPFAPAPVTPPAMPPPPVAGKPGVTTFPTPSRPVRVRRGTARLRFACSDPDGCLAATFVITRPAGRRPAITVPVKVSAAASGDHVVVVRLSRAARRALSKAGPRGMQVTMTRAATNASTRFRLAANR